jgi:hypothetical protein
VGRKPLCPLGLLFVRPHVHAGVSLGDGALSLNVTMTALKILLHVTRCISDIRQQVMSNRMLQDEVKMG